MIYDKWLEILIGGVVGYLIPHIISIVRFCFLYFERKPFEGIWYEYHLSNPKTSTKYEIVKNTWIIKKGIRSKYILESKNSEIEDIELKGDISFERNYMLIKMFPKRHEEEVYIRMYNPIPNNDNSISYGLFISLDFKGRAISSILVISKKELDNKIAEELLLSKKNMINDILLLLEP